MKRTLLLFGFLLTFLTLASFALTANASDTHQLPQFATPTPGPDGRILWTVQAGQTCSQISLLTGVSIDQLTALNKLDSNCTLTIGQQLLIGMAAASSGTPGTSGPAPTGTAGPPTATPLPGSGTICIWLFDDLNADGQHQPAEAAIAGGAVSVTASSGGYSKALTTTAGTDPTCFTGVPKGTYNISVVAPSGYDPTTQYSYTLDLKPGDQAYIPFGAQQHGANTNTATPPEPGNNDTLLAILGAVLLLGGGGLAVYAWSVYGRKPKKYGSLPKMKFPQEPKK